MLPSIGTGFGVLHLGNNCTVSSFLVHDSGLVFRDVYLFHPGAVYMLYSGVLALVVKVRGVARHRQIPRLPQMAVRLSCPVCLILPRKKNKIRLPNTSSLLRANSCLKSGVTEPQTRPGRLRRQSQLGCITYRECRPYPWQLVSSGCDTLALEDQGE